MEYLDNIGKRAQAAKPDLQHLKSEAVSYTHLTLPTNSLV